MTMIQVSKILPNPQQPRKNFNNEELKELARSIRQHGLINPICVEQAEGEMYILIDGERRLRAARMAGLTKIEASVRPPSNGTGRQDNLVLALVANLQRVDLNPIEQALAYKKMLDLGIKVIKIARLTGACQMTISERLRLLDLEEEIQDLIAEGLLPIDHRVVELLQSLPAEVRIEFSRRIARPNLSIKTILAAVAKYRAVQESESFKAHPAMVLAAREKLSRPDWDALHQLGKLPPWDMVIKNTNRTCNLCVLSLQASKLVCGECPVVVLLTSLIREVSHA